jgi:hypothetical protein
MSILTEKLNMSGVSPEKSNAEHLRPLCPQCRTGRLLNIPQEVRAVPYDYLCEYCYRMTTEDELQEAVRTDYADLRTQLQKEFDALVEDYQLHSALHKDTLRYGRKTVASLKEYLAGKDKS